MGIYKLNARMEQHFEKDLIRYHDIFKGGRCSGWELEELIVRAINSDTTTNHKALWKEGGHDDKADTRVLTESGEEKLQIKSGKVRKSKLAISGHRLGRFDGDFGKITNYLKKTGYNIIAVPYKQINDDEGRTHVYDICYIPRMCLKKIDESAWVKSGTCYIQTNDLGVDFSLRPKMSWQIWWKIPMSLVHVAKSIPIK